MTGWQLPGLPQLRTWVDDELERLSDELYVPLAEGVEGRLDDQGRYLVLIGIRATTPRVPGAVGRYLDGLPRDWPVMVPYVINPRLAGMLERRGFFELDRGDGVWVRP